MTRKLAAYMVFLAMLVPRAAFTLGLGAIEALSGLHEPLEARIALHGVEAGDIAAMRIALGSPTQFERVGVARTPYLASIKFTAVEQDDGGSSIRLRTHAPVTEPLLKFLIVVDWPHGRDSRWYTLVFDPPTPGRVSRAVDGSASYGPVRMFDTLWSLAQRLRPDDSVSTQRMMLAFLDANPAAFFIRNVNGLRVGVTLRIPPRDEIGPDDLAPALVELRRQYAAWEVYRNSSPSRAVFAPAGVAPQDTWAQQGDRIEVLLQGIFMDDAAPGEDDIQALRNENKELELRLAEAERHISKLNRVLELKNEEISILQSKLRASLRTETQVTGTARSAQPVSAPKSVNGALDKLPFGFDSFLNPVFLVAGAGLILALLCGAVLFERRRRAALARDRAYIVRDAVVVGLAEDADGPQNRSALDPDPDPDPARAMDIKMGSDAPSIRSITDITHDNRDQMEVRIREDIAAHPERPEHRMALLEIFHAARDPEKFEPAAVELRDMIDAADPMMEQVARLWNEFGTGRMLFAPAGGGTQMGNNHGALTGDDGARDAFDDPADGVGEFDIAGLADDAAPADPPGVVSEAGEVRDDPASGGFGFGSVEHDDYAVEEPSGIVGEEADGGEQAQTKIDLAQAYVEMGDVDGARRTLDEVLIDGDADQQEIAREMLSKLV